jgi:hypothetical protein
MRNSFFFSIAVVASIQLSAQKPFKKNTLYGELGGNGLVLSVNYERQMGNEPGLGLHIGLGLADKKPSIPLGVNYLFELGSQKSFIEAGAGITLAEKDLWDEKFNRSEHNAYKPGFIPSVGYRHHTPYGLMWKVIYTPVFSSYRNVPWLFGISVGWRI